MSYLEAIKKAEAMVAFITTRFIEDEQKLEECRTAQQLNKPMYAFVRKDIVWDKYKDFLWRKVFYWDDTTTDYEIKKILREIRDDLAFIKATGGP
jgi:hypothetical protein